MKKASGRWMSDVCELPIPQAIAHYTANSLSLSDCVAIANLLVAVIAVYLGWLAVRIARQTTKDAAKDCMQRKWFDLYLAAGQA